MDYSERESPNVYVKKKNHKIRACAEILDRIERIFGNTKLPFPESGSHIRKIDWWQIVLETGFL